LDRPREGRGLRSIELCPWFDAGVRLLFRLLLPYRIYDGRMSCIHFPHPFPTLALCFCIPEHLILSNTYCPPLEPSNSLLAGLIGVRNISLLILLTFSPPRYLSALPTACTCSIPLTFLPAHPPFVTDLLSCPFTSSFSLLELVLSSPISTRHLRDPFFFMASRVCFPFFDCCKVYSESVFSSQFG